MAGKMRLTYSSSFYVTEPATSGVIMDTVLTHFKDYKIKSASLERNRLELYLHKNGDNVIIYFYFLDNAFDLIFDYDPNKVEKFTEIVKELEHKLKIVREEMEKEVEEEKTT